MSVEEVDVDADVPRGTRRRKKGRRGKKAIEYALNTLMNKVDELPPDTAVKILASAIAWEKVKAKIAEGDNDFDPDNL